MCLTSTTTIAVLILAASLPAQKPAQKADRPSELTEKTLSACLASILPDPAENSWRQIAWWPDLSDAIVESRKQDKPILLWVMNGHPCGMT